MRWSNLTIDAAEQRRLPGYRDEAVVRLYSRGANAPPEERKRLSKMARRRGTPSGFRPVAPPPEDSLSDQPVAAPMRQEALF